MIAFIKGLPHEMAKTVGAFAVLGSLFSSQVMASAKPGSDFPAATVTRMVSGDRIAVGKSGRVTMVNLWATWCEACKVELAEMEKVLLPLRSNASGKEHQTPELMFVSLDKEPEKAREWFKKNTRQAEAMLANLYSDSSFELADKLEADSFPMTVVIGKDGKILHVERGFKEGPEGVAQVAKVAEILRNNL
jgi:thiol-disulfide isomerase/thioredoxin